MSINFVCRCGKKLCLSDALAGQKLMCPACKNWSIVPDPQQIVQLTPVEELAEPMLVTTIEDPGAPVVAEIVQPVPVREDKGKGGTYGLNSADAQLESRLRGAPSRDNTQFSGELGCFALSRDDERVQCVVYAADEGKALAAVGRTVHVLDLKLGK